MAIAPARFWCAGLGLGILIAGIVIYNIQCKGKTGYAGISCNTTHIRTEDPPFQSNVLGFVSFSTTFGCAYSDILLFTCGDPSCLQQNLQYYNSSWSCSTQDTANCNQLPITDPPTTRCTESIIEMVIGGVFFSIGLFCIWYWRHESCVDE